MLFFQKSVHLEKTVGCSFHALDCKHVLERTQTIKNLRIETKYDEPARRGLTRQQQRLETGPLLPSPERPLDVNLFVSTRLAFEVASIYFVHCTIDIGLINSNHPSNEWT